MRAGLAEGCTADRLRGDLAGQPGRHHPWFRFWINLQSGQWTAEGFGGPYTSGASDIGTAIIYAVVFAGLLALSYYAGPARYSADYYLEKKVSWWWRIAEMRRPAVAQAPVTETSAALPVPRQQTAPADAPAQHNTAA